jgi:hypothetical protein
MSPAASLLFRWWTKRRALVLVLAMGAACKGNRDVGLAITVPRNIVSGTAWFEIGAFKDATCAAVVPMLPNGVPEGYTARVAFRRDAPSTPIFGQIPNGRYAFAAAARGEDCAVLAIGCRDEDVGSAETVSIAMAPVAEPLGACTKGASCQAARCVPANDNSDPSVGAGCSLELLGAGPLAQPIGGAGTIVSAPAIARATVALEDGFEVDGFVIAYREVDPNGAGARITILPIDSSGGAQLPLRAGLPNACRSSDETDGVGLITDGGNAMMALAKAPCGGKAELQLLNFTTAPVLENGKFLVAESPTDVRVSLGAARPVARRPKGSVVVFTEGGTARIANMHPEKGITGPNGTFGATTGITEAWVAASDKVLALLAAGSGEGASQPRDAGADASTPGGSPEEPTLRLLVLPADTANDALDAAKNAPRPPVAFPGRWGSLAAIGGRVLVMSDGSGPGRSISYRAYDLGREEPSDLGGFSVEGAEPVTAGDVTIVGNRAYFATLKQGSVALHVFANATTTLTPLNSALFTREPRISAINTVRDGRVAVAATDRRVAVVWTTSRVLRQNDTTGGYAVFACTE